MGLISLSVKTLATVLGAALKAAPTLPPTGAEEMDWDGPDDIWPPEKCAELVNDCDVAELLAENEDELIVTRQFGLCLPTGDIAWNAWKGVNFEHPLDRVRMIAKLQGAATDCGWPIEEFISRYSWATRNCLAAVQYEDTGVYPLTDREIIAVSTPGEDTDAPDDHPSPRHPDGDLRPGPVGGDA